MNTFIRALACVFLCSLAMAAPASAVNLADCRAVVKDSERLACYDSFTASREASPARAGVGPDAPQADTGRGIRPDSVPASSADSEAADSLLAKAWDLDPDQRGHIFRIRPYQPVYILPFFHAADPNRRPSSPSAGRTVTESIDLSSTEAKLQFSLKTKLLEDVLGSDGDLWFGYTQSSRWHVYNRGESRPFRETNHEPELMYVWRTDYDLLGWRGRLVNLGINHQSNGRSLPLSRSWNRVMLSTSLEKDNWTMTLRPWWRVSERTSKDDNPDISNYLGRADLHLVRTAGKHQFSALLRHSLRGGDDSHGAVQLDYAFPITGDLRGHLQWFSGYGESLIDYNHRSNYIGVGVSLLEWY